VRDRYGLDDDLGELVAAYRRSYPGHVRPVDEETRTALAELRVRGWRIGIATNGEPSQLRKIELARPRAASAPPGSRAGANGRSTRSGRVPSRRPFG
jgi:hypothetical protein